MKGTLPIIGGSLLGTALLLGLAALLAIRLVGTPPQESASHSPAPTAPAPFTDLESAIAREGFSPDWEMHRRPDLPGPYRVVGLSYSIGANPIYSTVVSHLDSTGRPVAPIELRGHPDFSQMAIHLETPDGQITSAVLKR